MTKPTDILKEEHQVILKVLECLDNIASVPGPIPPKIGGKILDFIQNFADRCHHGKEEDRLFVMMEAQGFPRGSGPLGCMLEEHELGRQYVEKMKGSLDGGERGEKEQMKTFKNNALELVDLLRQHIAKEDNILFPMAESNLEEEDESKLWEEFQEVESLAGGRRHHHYIELAREICEHCEVEVLPGDLYPQIQRYFLT